MDDLPELEPMKDGVGQYYAKKFPGGVGYFIAFPDRRGHQTTRRGFKTRREAKVARARILAAIADKTYIGANRGKITIGELGEQWINSLSSVLTPTTWRKYESTWRIWVKPDWKDWRVEDVTRSAIQNWVNDISDEVGAGTVRDALSKLRMILDDAVLDRRIPSSPCVKIKTPRVVTSKRRVYLTMPQLLALAEEADRRKNQYGTLVLVMGLTGLRFGEAIALRVKDVDFKENLITICDNAVWSHDLYHNEPKNHDNRVVPFPPQILGQRLRDATADKDPNALLFPRPGVINDGDNLTKADYVRRPDTRDGWFAESIKRVKGIPDTMTPHDLRHTAVSLAIHAKVNPLLVARIAGHRDFSTTMRVYADLYNEDLAAAGAALDAEARNTD